MLMLFFFLSLFFFLYIYLCKMVLFFGRVMYGKKRDVLLSNVIYIFFLVYDAVMYIWLVALSYMSLE